ncbi:MAG: MMPL family transporter, partial [Myxococcota bacterium]|nr:MMPL family transporter [Myxococcota bacterium]
IGFRELRSVFIIFVPLIIGSLWTWGFASIVVGALNSFTSFFTAILLGLGVDFSIHLYSRYREERARVQTGQEAVIRAWDQVGPPCFTAAVTSAAGFISLQFAGFVGFKQLGILLCGGVLLCLMAILLTLPLLIQLRERQSKPVKVAEIPQTSNQIPDGYRFSNFGLAIALVLGAVALSTVDRVGFEYDISNLRKQGLSYEELNDSERAFAERSFTPVIASFPDADSLHAAHVALNSAAETSSIIRGGLSQFTVLPHDQTKLLEEVTQIHALATHENAIYLPGMLKQNLQPLVNYPPQALSVEDFPPGLQHILGASNGHHRLVIAPSGNMWDIRQNAELRSELERLLPNAELAGEYLAMASLFELIKDDGPKISIIALVLVFIVSLLDLRSFKRAISAVVILATGIAWAGAAMWVMGIKLSLLNFVGLPIMMGIGIDIIIHLLHRIDKEGPGRIGFALRTTGWAAVLSTLTTMFSFAALLIAENRGIHSLGQMIVAGLFLVGTAAFIAVPLGWISVWRRRGQA